MPPKHSLATLFHPKKKNVRKDGQASSSTSPRKPQSAAPASNTQSGSDASTPPTSTPRPTPPNGSAAGSSSSQLHPSRPHSRQPSFVAEDDEVDEEFKLPEGPFQEFRLMSSALNGWKYDVMKFDSRKTIDISLWEGPIKLNRKETRKDEPPAEPTTPVPVTPMLGQDSKPVIGSDGKVVMLDAEGKPIHGGGKGKGSLNGKKRFQKKTRQVFYVPDEVRRLRREERYPWVMEDSRSEEYWVGHLEEVSKADTHAFFMPAANDVFKFVPAHRWYKFQKKVAHGLPTEISKVEQLYTKNQKRDPAVFLAAKNGGKGPSAATVAMFKAEAEGRAVAGPSSLVHTASNSLGPGGRRLRAVDSGADLFEDDEQDGESRRRKEKDRGGEGDMDEQLYEDEFADDDEKMEPDPDDEEAKEIEERLKREYQKANKIPEGEVEEFDDDDTPGMSKQAKAMQKLIRNREGNDAYDSDEEKNPYATSEEEEEEEAAVVTGEPAIQQQPQQKAAQVAKEKEESVAGITAPSSPPLGGHSVVAKRATSPNVPKPNLSRGASPMGSRATSPLAGSRATSPSATPQPSNGTSKTSVPMPGNKRKASEDPISTNSTSGAAAAPKLKKRKPLAPGVPAGELTEKVVIDWLKTTPNASTRDCIQYFTPWLKDDPTKARFTALVKEVAQLNHGILVLRSAYRGGSTGPSPPGTPST